MVITVLILVVPVAYFAYIMLGSHDLTADERIRMKAYIWLFVAAALFWMIYDLAPSKLLFFAADHTDLSLFGVPIQAATTQSFNPLFIMIFVPVFAALWVRLGTRVSTPQKFGFALVMVGLSFVGHGRGGGAGRGPGGCQCGGWCWRRWRRWRSWPGWRCSCSPGGCGR